MPDKRSSVNPPLPTGVWRRARWDWAYRFEIEGYGSVFGCGFMTREKAREAMLRVRAETEAKINAR